MKVRTLLTAAVVAAASLVATGVAGAKAAPSKPVAPHYYLALGDSLSTGLQPNANGVPGNTTQGYVNDLYAYEQKYVKGLTLVQMGCPNDTTASMLTGKGNAAVAKYFKCDRQGGSQVAAAVAFLKTHHTKGEVPLITLDIGANDVDSCGTAANLGACITAGLGSIAANLPKILSALRAAAPAGTKFAGMNLYDPDLSYYLLPTTNPSQPLGLASIPFAQQFNSTLTSAFNKAHVKVADVASAFDMSDSSTMVTWNGVSVPRNVALLCAWTWNCAPPPVGPNIHPNQLGYGVIAQAFEKVVGKL